MDLSWAPSVPKSMWMLSSLTQVRTTEFGFKSNMVMYQQHKNVDAYKQETFCCSVLCLLHVWVSLLEGFYDWDSKSFQLDPVDMRFIAAKIRSFPWAFLLQDGFQPSSQRTPYNDTVAGHTG